MDSEVVHDHYGLALGALPLELSDKRNEQLHCIRTCKDMNEDEAVLYTESPNE